MTLLLLKNVQNRIKENFVLCHPVVHPVDHGKFLLDIDTTVNEMHSEKHCYLSSYIILVLITHIVLQYFTA